MRVSINLNMDLYGNSPITGIQTFYAVCVRKDSDWSVVKSLPTKEQAMIEMAKVKARDTNKKLNDRCFRILEFSVNFSSL